MSYQTKSDSKHKISAWVDTELYTKVKQTNSNRGAIAEAINEGMRLYLEKQAQNASK